MNAEEIKAAVVGVNNELVEGLLTESKEIIARSLAYILASYATLSLLDKTKGAEGTILACENVLKKMGLEVIVSTIQERYRGN